jgi:hypothetical protein
MDQKNRTDEPNIDSAFLTLLQLHRHGQALDDLSAAMRAATEAAHLHGKVAIITLKIAIKPAGNGSGAVVVADDIKVKLPEPAKTTSFFFCDEHGNLHRNDPRQKELPLRAIEGGAAVDVQSLKKVS